MSSPLFFGLAGNAFLKKNHKKSRNRRPWYPRMTLKVNIHILWICFWMVPHIWHLNLNAYCEGSQRENNCKHDNLKSKRHTLIKHTWLRNNNALHRDYNTPEIVSWTNICISIKLHYLSSSRVAHGFVTLLWWWSLQFLMNPTAATQGFCFTPCRSNHAGFVDS